jgi:L-ribulose-5-phosphate 3-epimerase
MMHRRDLLRTLAGGVAVARLAHAARITRGNVCFITDEVSRDLSTALKFASEFGVRQVEIRNVDDKYCFRHDPSKLKEIHAQLKEHGIRVAVLGTPVLKCTLPGLALTPESDRASQGLQKDLPIPRDQQFGMQMDLLHQAIEAARLLDTDMLRIFAYWRVQDLQKAQPHIVEGLSRIAEVAAKEKIRLCLENENACNVATSAEAAAILAQVKSPALGLNWDFVNAINAGETAYPDGFNKLDKKRIWHVHVKDVRIDPATKQHQVCAVGDGMVPHHEIFTSLAKAGYKGALSMETHFSINGQRDPASRRSMQGIMKVIDGLG